MNLLYNTGIRLYSLAARAAATRSPKISKMVSGQRLTFDKLEDARSNKAPRGFDVWIHASSLGEFEQARPLIERLRRERPGLTILLTFFSPSGYEVRKGYDKVDAVCYLPFDNPSGVKRFLDAASPKMAIFIKYEFWGNYLHALRRRGIPTYIVSAIFRPSQIFFKPWGGMFRGMLKCFKHIFVQDEASKRLLAGIGVDNVTVAGDTRFDRVTDVMRTTTAFPLIENWKGESKVLIAGSSWEPDEDCYVPYINSHPDLKVIIAPHEFDAKRLARLRKAIKGKTALFSEAEKAQSLPSDTQAVIINSFGKLSSLYRYGDAAIIGGGFGAGIHNINEAAVYGLPVIFGPKHAKFKEAADLLKCGGAAEYGSHADIERILDGFFYAPGAEAALAEAGAKAAKYIKDSIGATDKVFKHIFND